MTESSQSDAAERETAMLLAERRAVPAAAFRGRLGRELAAEDPGYGPRPARLRSAALLLLSGGGALVGLGALQAVGVL